MKEYEEVRGNLIEMLEDLDDRWPELLMMLNIWKSL